MSTPPNDLIARSTSAATSSFLVTSAGMASTSAFVLARISSAAVFRSLSVREHITIFAPSAARPSAHALPMPLLAAVTSATLPPSPRSMLSSASGLFEELRAIARRHLDAAGLAVAHHLEGQPLAGLVAPEREIKLLAAADFLRVERHDEVALLQAAAIARALRHDAGDHHALVDGMGEDAQPGAPRSAHDAAVAEQLALVLAVALHRDRQRAPGHLVEVQRDDPEERAGHRVEGT